MPVPLISTVYFALPVILPSTYESLILIFAPVLDTLTNAVSLPVNFTLSNVNSVAFANSKPVLPFKSTVDLLAPFVTPIIDTAVPLVSPTPVTDG